MTRLSGHKLSLHTIESEDPRQLDHTSVSQQLDSGGSNMTLKTIACVGRENSSERGGGGLEGGQEMSECGWTGGKGC